MGRWCIKRDISLNDNGFNPGCNDEWGAHHNCDECPFNRNMGDTSAFKATSEKKYVWNYRENEYPFSGTLEECEAYMKEHFPLDIDACILP